MDLGHWEFDQEFNTEDWFGFIYRIIEKSTGKQYLGKKQFFSVKRKKVEGKKNRKKTTKESDWRKYVSSSDDLKAGIAKDGKENYIFLIESLQPTKGALSYAEIELQIIEDVLRAKNELGEKKFYNKCIGQIKFTPPDKSKSLIRSK